MITTTTGHFTRESKERQVEGARKGGEAHNNIRPKAWKCMSEGDAGAASISSLII